MTFTPNDYCSITEVKQAMPDRKNTLFVQSDGTPVVTYDSFLTALCTRASRYFDRITKRFPGAYYVTVDTTKYYDGIPYSEYGLSSDQVADNLVFTTSLINVPSLAIDEIADEPTFVGVAISGDRSNYTQYSAATDYFLWPYNAIDENRPYVRVYLDTIRGTYQSWYGYRKGVKITGKFGYSKTVPDAIKQGCIEQVVRWFKRGQQLYQDIGVANDPEQLIYKIMDDDFTRVAASYRRQII